MAVSPRRVLALMKRHYAGRPRHAFDAHFANSDDSKLPFRARALRTYGTSRHVLHHCLQPSSPVAGTRSPMVHTPFIPTPVSQLTTLFTTLCYVMTLLRALTSLGELPTPISSLAVITRTKVPTPFGPFSSSPKDALQRGSPHSYVCHAIPEPPSLPLCGTCPVSPRKKCIA